MHPDWKPNWAETRERLLRWWNHQGLVVHFTTARPAPRAGIQPPPPAADLTASWLDPAFRTRSAHSSMAACDFTAESFPYFDTHIGPGSLSLILGSEAELSPDTVWYKPCITDPDRFGKIEARLDADNRWWQAHMALVNAGLELAEDKYLVGMPDLVEGLDTLAAMRGNMETVYDLTERPGWVEDRLWEINQAYFAVFQAIFERIRDEFGGNAFCAFQIWGPGKTAKLQCDFSAMISPKMFRQFVSPYLAEQCRWLDYSMYHLDGTNARQHVEPLLEIDELKAIEWTPQAGKPGGGSPEWYDLYRRILAGGKSVQAIGVELHEVIPLLDAVGPKGMFIMLNGSPYAPAEGEKLLKDLESYY
jgi:hypothetical protein